MRTAPLLAAALAALTLPAHAAPPKSLAVRLEQGAVQLPDTPVVDQFGTPRGFREALGGGVFVLGFTYTDCESICWMTDNWMSAYAEGPGAADAPARLVTLTLDPANDAPADLLARHRAFGSPPDWLRLTGRPSDVLPLLVWLGARDGRPLAEHEALLLVGDARTGAMTTVRADDPFTVDRIAAAVAAYAH